MLFQRGMQIASLKFKELTEPVVPWRLQPPLYPPLAAHPLAGNEALFADKRVSIVASIDQQACSRPGAFCSFQRAVLAYPEAKRRCECFIPGEVVLRCVAHRE